MHFSIPDTQEFIDTTGNSYVGYNIHINGLFHCTVRYKQLLNLHEQLIKNMDVMLPSFPPKKFFPLTANQQEDRRLCLEKYIQTIGQNPAINNSKLLNGFLLNAQQETFSRMMESVDLSVFLMDNQKLTLKVSTDENSQKVLEKVCKLINLPRNYESYFCLFIITKTGDNNIDILRKLHDFESPVLTMDNINQYEKQIVVGKNYWDITNDLKLIQNPISLNLLYIQAIAEVDRGWIIVPNQLKTHLNSLKEEENKVEYLKLVSTFKYYGYLQFKMCYCDYPEPGTKVIVSIGGHELNLRIYIDDEEHEAMFKVTRMRCWRITTLQNGFDKKEDPNNFSLELSFEYLVAKNQLQWITISSEQAILMSVCLQSMIDELLLKHVHNPNKNNQMSDKSWTYVTRDGHSRVIVSSGLPDDIDNVQKDKPIQDSNASDLVIKKFSDRFSSSMKTKKTGDVKNLTKINPKGTSSCDIMENNAFHMIGDDDL
ncbi:sorting nexin-17 [Chelonus insularis]|uniref:sorting nexin-17 n=1 Tax=Chelonus insularis TaxID=460826 RepID=UPI0015891B1E|nr:sorting nexin-17 [Chelonus insularis]